MMLRGAVAAGIRRGTDSVGWASRPGVLPVFCGPCLAAVRRRSLVLRRGLLPMIRCDVSARDRRAPGRLQGLTVLGEEVPQLGEELA